MSSTPDRIPKPRTAPPLTPAGKAHKFQLHIVHTLMGNSYLTFKDLQEDIKSGFLKEILELPGKEGEPISRCYGAVLSWIASARSPRHQGHPVHGLHARRPLPTTPVPVPVVAEVAVPPLPPDMCSRSHRHLLITRTILRSCELCFVGVVWW